MNANIQYKFEVFTLESRDSSLTNTRQRGLMASKTKRPSGVETQNVKKSPAPDDVVLLN